MSYDDQSEKIGTNYQKTRPEIPARNAGNLKARFENMAKQNEEEAKKRAEEEKKRREEKDKQVWFLNDLKDFVKLQHRKNFLYFVNIDFTNF